MPPRREFWETPRGVSYQEGYETGYRDGYIEGQRFAGAGLPGQLMLQRNPAPRRAPRRKANPVKRRPSAYSKAYGVIYKQLKKKHPRASFGSLSKKAHAATRKKRGMKKGKK